MKKIVIGKGPGWTAFMIDDRDAYELFIGRLLEFGVIEWEEYHIEMGKYWGYNRCCIETFVRLNRTDYPAGLTMDAMYGIDSVTHVRCVKCRQPCKTSFYNDDLQWRRETIIKELAKAREARNDK